MRVGSLRRTTQQTGSYTGDAITGMPTTFAQTDKNKSALEVSEWRKQVQRLPKGAVTPAQPLNIEQREFARRAATSGAIEAGRAHSQGSTG